MGKLEQFAESRFMRGLQAGSQKLAQSAVFATISGGMGATMGLIMLGAVVQIICAIGSMAFGWQATDPLYQTLNVPYKVTMGLLGLFMCFGLAYNYAKRLKLPQLQCAFTALVCFILVCSPPITAMTEEGGATFDAINLNSLGANGIFVAILISMLSVKITKIAVDHNWVIRMPDVVPEGILNSFNSIIPAGINLILWYGLSVVINSVTGGKMTLATIITTIISTPMSYLVSTPGMFIILILFGMCWFFGIHGGSVVFTAIMVQFFAAYTTNAELAASGQPLVYNPVFIYGALSLLGGSGNTLVLCLMGLKSKSKQISAVSKAALPAGLFNINEPAIFGFPILYNPILAIPFILNPIVCGIFMLLAWNMGLMEYPKILIMTTLPIGVQQFMATLDWKNVVFVVAMFPICWLIYYPFFKVYEKQCLEREAQEEVS